MKNFNLPKICPSATRKDVARKAGVSVATVTHALNPENGIKIKPETRQKVLEAAKLLNYHPSYIGTALTSGRSFNMGVLFRSLKHLDYYFYRKILLGLGMELELDNYNLSLFLRTKEMRYLESVRSGRVDGIFVLQGDLEDPPIMELAKTGIPLVVIDRIAPVENQPSVSSVLPDSAGLIATVIEDFVKKGYRNMMIVNKTDNSIDSNIRMNQAFLRIAEEYAERGVTASLMSRPAPDVFREQFKNIIVSGKYPDALYINRILYAQIACEVMASSGLRPDKDIKIASAEPGIFAPCKHNINVYTPDGEQIGKEAWRLMKKIMENKKTVYPPVFVPYQKHQANKIATDPEDEFSSN